jgi:hypothetical protein
MFVGSGGGGEGGHEDRGGGDNSQSLFIYLYVNSVMANYKKQLQQTHTMKTKRRKENKVQTLRQNIVINTIIKTLLNFILITSIKNAF